MRAIRIVVTLLVVAAIALAPLPSALADEPELGVAGGVPRLWVTPLSLDFGPVGLGSTSPAQTVTIHNVGSAPVTGFAGGVPSQPEFGFSSTCGASLVAGGHCHYTYHFAPGAVGVVQGTSVSTTNAGSIAVALRGEGTGALLHATPLMVDFGSVMSGSTATPITVTVRNAGLAPLTGFAGGAVYAPFNGTQNCAPSVAPGGACQVFYQFAPTAAGTFTATSHVSTNGGSFSVDLQGTGRPLLFVNHLRVSPRVLDFGPVGVGQTSATQNATFTYQYLPPLGGSAITGWAGGGFPGDSPFHAVQNCASELDPGDSCHFEYTFSPSAAGVYTATSSISNSRGTYNIEVRGTGVAPSLSASPLVLDFGPVPIGETSPVQEVVIRNTGLSTLADWAGGGFPSGSPFHASQNCAAGVPPGGACKYSFTFAPSAAGRYTAVSSTSTNAGNMEIVLYGGQAQYAWLPVVRR